MPLERSSAIRAETRPCSRITKEIGNVPQLWHIRNSSLLLNFVFRTPYYLQATRLGEKRARWGFSKSHTTVVCTVSIVSVCSICLRFAGLPLQRQIAYIDSSSQLEIFNLMHTDATEVPRTDTLPSSCERKDGYPK